jgi:hypothetical protein
MYNNFNNISALKMYIMLFLLDEKLKAITQNPPPPLQDVFDFEWGEAKNRYSNQTGISAGHGNALMPCGFC